MIKEVVIGFASLAEISGLYDQINQFHHMGERSEPLRENQGSPKPLPYEVVIIIYSIVEHHRIYFMNH